MAPQQKEPQALQPFLSLRAAAALAYTAATGKYTSDIAALNDMARIVAGITAVFTRSAHPEPARVLPLELSEGRIEHGGDVLRFSDGRPTLGDLAILHRELANVLEQVSAQYGRARAKARRGGP
jgi:hypothetical protein